MRAEARTLEPVEAAYVAGLMDGEGTVTLSRVHKYRQRGIALTISNTERGLVLYMREVVGAGSGTTKRRSKLHHTPSFVYHLNDRRALDLLRQIRPYMTSHKADRADALLKDYVRLTPRNGRYSAQILREREQFVRRFFG